MAVGKCLFRITAQINISLFSDLPGFQSGEVTCDLLLSELGGDMVPMPGHVPPFEIGYPRIRLTDPSHVFPLTGSKCLPPEFVKAKGEEVASEYSGLFRAAHMASNLINREFLTPLNNSDLNSKERRRLVAEFHRELPKILMRRVHKKQDPNDPDRVLYGKTPNSFQKHLLSALAKWAKKIKPSKSIIAVSRSITRAQTRGNEILRASNDALKTDRKIAAKLKNKTEAEITAYLEAVKEKASQFAFAEDKKGVATIALYQFMQFDREARLREQDNPGSTTIKTGYLPEGLDNSPLEIEIDTFLNAWGAMTNDPKENKRRRDAIFQETVNTTKEKVLILGKNGKLRGTVQLCDVHRPPDDREGLPGRHKAPVMIFDQINRHLRLPLDLHEKGDYQKVDLSFIPRVFEKVPRFLTACKIARAALIIQLDLNKKEDHIAGAKRQQVRRKLKKAKEMGLAAAAPQMLQGLLFTKEEDLPPVSITEDFQHIPLYFDSPQERTEILTLMKDVLEFLGISLTFNEKGYTVSKKGTKIEYL